MIYAARLIRNGYLDWAIAGGTDALSRFTINGFNSLMILDNELCRPFDDTRKGLNLGEGAGYVVLASEKMVALLAQQPTVKLSGFANANDAYHQTASSPEGRGNFDAMSGALAEAGLQPSDIDYINLHGTGTANNDSSEGIAISRLFGTDLPYVSSTKTYTGHTLAACGGIEAIYATLAIEEGVVFPNLRFQHQMKELEFAPQTNLLEGKEIRHVLSNSFGFGGNCTSLIFSKVK
jgi:3-oxoacyl-[acyl-carrier-protein] synthase-1